MLPKIRVMITQRRESLGDSDKDWNIEADLKCCTCRQSNFCLQVDSHALFVCIDGPLAKLLRDGANKFY